MKILWLLFIILLSPLFTFGAELQVVKIEGTVLKFDEEKICFKNNRSITCIRNKPEFKEYKESKDPVFFVVNKKDVI